MAPSKAPEACRDRSGGLLLLSTRPGVAAQTAASARMAAAYCPKAFGYFPCLELGKNGI